MVLKVLGKLAGHVAIGLAAKVITLGLIAYVGHVGFQRVADGKPLLPSFSSSEEPTPAEPAADSAHEPEDADAKTPAEPSFPWVTRTLAWLGVAALLPIATFALLRALARKRSNGANAAALMGYTGVDLILAAVLLGGALAGWPLAMLLLMTALLGLFYNMHVMTWAVKLEE